MSHPTLPTENPAALMSFVQGRHAFNAYLGSGNAEDLQRARKQFGEASGLDPRFDLAAFYQAVSATELRDRSSIEILERLSQRPVEFLPETFLQLAYAYTKQYEDDLYLKAEMALDKALDAARSSSRKDLVAIIEAYRVFLFSVMGGRYSDRSLRPRYLQAAIERGEKQLRDRATLGHPSRDQILFELHNSLGIAYWRQGEQQDETRAASWSAANKHFDEALRLRPNSTRVMQNQASLLAAEADRLMKDDEPSARALYDKASAKLKESINLNPIDQFPHYCLSVLAVKLGNWNEAQEYFDGGINQPGSVKPKSWDALREAISQKDASLLPHS
jgi:tetratricopeptide (TPR) repeat protein